MILSLIEQDGGTLRKVAGTGGGEHSGACPFCGGKDRFRVWPESGRYWCRSCDKKGDEIQYLRDYRGMGYRQACVFLGKEPRGLRYTRPAPARWAPKEATPPAELWQTAAKSFLDRAKETLWSPQGDTMRQWLHTEKGLRDATIQEACIGMNPTDLYVPRAAWGLEPVSKQDGTEKKLWIPAGLIIPYIVNGAVHRLRMRRNDPGGRARYVVISGSGMAPMTWGQNKGVAVIVESELDGLLLSQEAGDLCAVVAMGSATAKPDTATHELLRATPLILVSLDSDEAGVKASWDFWPKTYGTQFQRWPCLSGKDPSESWKHGLNLHDWAVAGIFETTDELDHFEERAAIMEYDGNLTREQAEWETMKALHQKEGINDKF